MMALYRFRQSVFFIVCGTEIFEALPFAGALVPCMFSEVNSIWFVGRRNGMGQFQEGKAALTANFADCDVCKHYG